MDEIEAAAAAEAKALHDAILKGAKAAREVGKSKARTFEIGEGLLAMRSQCLIQMGKDPRINDRSILKTPAYRDLMGRALKTYPDYTLNTVFKNDSTRLAYLFCAEYRDQIEAAFAAAEVANPGSTIRICNPERIKGKFKALINPPVRKTKAQNQAEAEQEAQARDDELKAYREEWRLKYEALKLEYDALFELVGKEPKTVSSAAVAKKARKERKEAEAR